MSKTNVCWVVQSCPTLCDPMDCRLPGSSVHRILQARILEWVVMPSSRGSSQSRIEPRSRALQVDSLPSEPAGKPENTGVGSLSLLQGILLTQESNWGLLHCRWILYQLSYREAVIIILVLFWPMIGLCFPTLLQVDMILWLAIGTEMWMKVICTSSGRKC